MKKKLHPPRIPDLLLRFFSQRYATDEIQGDLHELFYDRIKRKNIYVVRFLFWWETFLALPTLLKLTKRRNKRYTQNTLAMVKNNLKLSLRHILKRPVYSITTISGLALGVAVCLLIFYFIQFELSFDKFHAKEENIVAVNYEFITPENQTISPSVPYFVGPKIRREFPEVETQCRLLPVFGTRVVRVEDKIFEESAITFADSTFFDVFTFQLSKGRLSDQLKRPATILLTESMSKKYFGDKDPVGKSIRVGLEKDYEITGVIQDVPANSHFTFDFLASFSSLELPVEEVWDSPNYQTYLLLHSNVNQEAFETKVNHTLLGEKNNEKKIRVQLHIQPLGNIHFDTTVANYMNKVSDKRYVLIFSIIAVLILLIASINYINLTTARAAERGREVGIRKAAGATGNQLFKQFMTDSIVHIAPAVILASLIFLSSIPFLDSYLGLNMNTSHTINYSLVILMSSAIFAGVTLFAGLYPAVILTRFKPALVLKGKFNFSSSATSFRKALVVFQFCISIALIICTLVISNQLEFMQQAKLGFEKEHTLILPMDSETEKNFSSIRSELNQLSSVQAVVPASAPPTEIIIGYGAFLDKDQKDVSTVGSMRTNADCIDALGMKLVQGRNFDPTRENIADAEPQFIVNQAFLSTFNLTVEEALGKKIFLGVARGEGEIIGIVQNFHAGSLHKKIEPIVLYDKNGWLNKILIKMTPGHVPDQLKEIGGVWGKLVPHRPFAFTFLDENYDRLYANEKRISILLKSFSSLAIFIACLGVLGLVSYATLQRTKEIGIRKVLGATVGHVMILISKDFVRLILIAFVLAVPLAYFSVSNWLENFEYRIGIGIPEFLLAGSLALGLALLTIIYQAVKASMINPAITLRSE